jgi:hypothetical protein
LLLAVLVYVSLDLSVAAMPGAFMFEPEDSVESLQSSRGRAPAGVVALPALDREPSTPSSAAIDRRVVSPRPSPATATAPAFRTRHTRPSRAALDPALSPDDAH